MNKHKRGLIAGLLAILLVPFLITGCSKEQKKYDGDPQLAFSDNSYSFSISSSDQYIEIPVQLIADKKMSVTGEVNIDQNSTAAQAASLSGSFTIPSGEFSTAIKVNIDYDKLPAGKSTLTVNLSSDIKVAKYYSSAIISLRKL